MLRMKRIGGLFLGIVGLATVGLAQGTAADYQRSADLSSRFAGKVFRDSVRPNWLPNGSLWYSVRTGPDRTEWVLVTRTGSVQRFPTRSDLEKAAGGSLNPVELPFTTNPRPSEAGERVSFTFVNQTDKDILLFWVNGSERVAYGSVPMRGERTMSTYSGHAWELRQGSSSLGYVTAPAGDARFEYRGQAAERPAPARDPRRSPDGRYTAELDSHNVLIRDASSGTVIVRTVNGSNDDSYRGTRWFWSPDSRKLVVFRTVPSEGRRIPLVESSPRDQLQPKLQWIGYLKPGDRIAQSRPVMLDVRGGKSVEIDNALFSDPWSLPGFGDGGFANGVTWTKDSDAFFFAYNQRGHQLMRVIRVDAANGSAQSLFEDKVDTFIHYSKKYWARYLPQSNQILWMSERSGWNHLHLHDALTGGEKSMVTSGDWVVDSVESFNDAKGELLIRVLGAAPGQDPYHAHYFRVGLDGKRVQLTYGDGTHRLEFSPDGEVYVDTFSRVDLPSVTELRRTSDGGLITQLEAGDASALIEAGWQMPERFAAPGRDGKTMIYGVVYRPTNFDPAKKYAVIEQIYAGPHGFHVPKAWSSGVRGPQRMAELGFIVVQIDGMGTDGRGKAFHDVAFQNLKDAGFPDRIKWMQALAAKYPQVDVSRVGIYGGSAGGQNAMAALLWHGDFYKAAAADCGCHDNRMDKVWWNEQWMSYPVGKAYEENSNVVNAHLLRGKLLLTVGELDTNVDPASTMQVADALIRANKDFELIVFPGGGHGAGDSPYGQRRRMDFFIRALYGVEPRR